MHAHRLLTSLATAAILTSAHANLATIEVDSVATEVLGTPVAIHRMYARLTPPATRVGSVQNFQVVVGSALFHHRDFESEGALSTELGVWSPYQTSTLMSSGDSYVILGGNAGAAANGSILFANWLNSEFANAQPTFHGQTAPGVSWISGNITQGVADASGRVLLGQFVTRREDAFTARFDLILSTQSSSGGFWFEPALAHVTLGSPADECPDDLSKVLPGQCGCGNADIDSDGDGAADCLDRELALVQRIDFAAPENFAGIGTASDIRADGDHAVVAAQTSTTQFGTATILRRETGKDGVSRWITRGRIGGIGEGAWPVTRAAIAISGDRAAARVRNGSQYPAVALHERAADGSWPLVRVFTPDPPSGNLAFGFGQSVALHGDWLAISSGWRNGNPPLGIGRVELHRRDANGWTLATTIERTMQDGGAVLGRALALGDGVLAASDGQVVFIYRQGKTGSWDLAQQFSPPEGFGVSVFGESLALDGDVLVAGCSDLYSGTPHAIGGAIVYRRGADGLFAQEAVLRPEELVLPLAPWVGSNTFGEVVSISGDTVAVGGQLTRRAYVFRRGSDGAWRCANVMTRNAGQNVSFGHGLALAGGQLLVGAPDFSQSAPARPWVDVFDLDPVRFGDLDGDGAIGPTDLAMLLETWGSGSATEDLDGDGVVGPRDLVILLGLWSTP